MESSACNMEVEWVRSYMDDLYSAQPAKRQGSIVSLKNSVIGNNKQKASVISQGIVPRLIIILEDSDAEIRLRHDAGIVIGSLAQGGADEVRALLDYGVVSNLLQIILNPTSDSTLVEICLKALRSLYKYTFVPHSTIVSNADTLHYLIDLAAPTSSIDCQESIASIMHSVCNSYMEQMALFKAGVLALLARMLTSDQLVVKTPALKCMASMCFTNRAVSDAVCSTTYRDRRVPDILTNLTSRAESVEIQLTAARCLTYLHRSGSIAVSDYRIEFKTLPTLARLCTSDYKEDIRATAAETLAYLAEIDSKLQRLAAISNHLIISLSSLLKCGSTAARQGAFRCFASLGANDEDIRKRIINMDGMMDGVLKGLSDSSCDVRLAAVRCLHSLSRSVQQLRTTFQDHAVWRPLMDLLNDQPSNELMTVVTSTICNLLLEFSPAKEPLLESGAVKILCDLTNSTDSALRLNGCWALMNMAFQSESHVKTKIINTLGTDRLFQLLDDPTTNVTMKTLGLLRNLLSSPQDIHNIMSEHSTKIMEAINWVLDSAHSSDVKEQALCIVSNIATAAQVDYVLDDANIMKKLGEFVVSKDQKLHTAAFEAINGLVGSNGVNAVQRKERLREAGILKRLQESLEICKGSYKEISTLIDEFNYPT